MIALDGVDLDIERGQIHGLVGPNGAGKTTLLGLLLGLAVADSGDSADPRNRRRRRADDTGRCRGIRRRPRLYPSLTARQNLQSVVSLRGRSEARPDVEEALAIVGLGQVAGDPVRGFSLGMRQRLGLASALLTEPRLLVLDEPANGLDPSGKRQIHGVLTDLAQSGATVILSSHRMDDMAALCADVTLLSAGRVVFSGPPHKLAVEGGQVDYRILTTDHESARRVAEATEDLQLVDLQELRGRSDTGWLVVRGPESAVDAFVARLVGAGIGIRELGPRTPPRSRRRLPGFDGSRHLEGCRGGHQLTTARDEQGARSMTAGTLDHPRSAPATQVGLLPVYYRFELAKLGAQWRVRAVFLACLIVPALYTAVVSSQTSLPADSVYGRWMNQSGWPVR